MIYRIRQAWRALTAKPNLKERELALSYLQKEWERELFLALSPYDQNHSIRILKEMLLAQSEVPDILLRLALLHDVGKDPTLTLFDRALYSKFRISRKNIGRHPQLGYEKVYRWDRELAELIARHHSGVQNELILQFQYFDNRN